MKANRAYTDAEDIADETVETQIAAFDGFCQCQALGLEEPAEIKPDQNYARRRHPLPPCLADIHRMPALLTLSVRLSTDFGNAKPSTRGSRAPKPATLARRA